MKDINYNYKHIIHNLIQKQKIKNHIKYNRFKQNKNHQSIKNITLKLSKPLKFTKIKRLW